MSIRRCVLAVHWCAGDLHAYTIHAKVEEIELDIALTGQVPAWRPATAYTRRDRVMMPAYESTVAHTRLRDQPPEDVAWLRTLLSSPVLLRVLAHAVPRLVAQVYPAQAIPRLTGIAQLFSAAPAPAAAAEL